MTDALHASRVDYFAEPFLPDGEVDWPAARQWVAAVHDALAAHPEAAWTDVHAAWFGRLVHDALRYQGVALAHATPDTLADLLLTLQPAQRDTAPGSIDTALAALRAFYTWGTTHHGAVAAATALAWLTDPDQVEACQAAMQPGGRTRAQRRRGLQRTPAPARPARPRSPARRKKKRRKKS